ncbi:MAG: DNA-processing protein DprA, partial [bacterium]
VNRPGAQSTAAITSHLLSSLGRGASLEELCLAMERPPHELFPLLLELEASGTLMVEPGLFWRPR